MKKLIYGLIGLVVVLVAAVFIVPALIDWDSYKAEIAAEVKAATGRDLAIDGDISVSLLPSPHASVSGIRFANVEGASEPDMLRLEEASADIALWPLLGGDVEVESVTLVNPEIVLETTADGKSSWDLAPAAVPAETETADDGFDMRLADVRIQGGRVRYLEAGTEVAVLEALDAQLAAESLSGPFSANGSATLNGLPFRFDAGIGALEGSPQLSVRILTDAGAGEASIDGKLADGGFAGTVVLAAENGQAFVAALATAAGSDVAAPDMLAGALSLYSELTASPESISADKVTLTLGDSRLEGHARLLSADDAGGRSFDVALAGERLDVDAILAAMAGAEGEAAPTAEEGGFALPPDLSGHVALEFGTVVLQGGELGGVVLDARLADGKLSLERAVATLPGGSPLAVQGAVTAEGGAPHFAGSVELSSASPRELLAWAQVDPGPLPDGALQSFAFNGGVDANGDAIRLDPFVLSLDDSTVQGALALSLAGTPSLTLSGNVDRLDADRYLGPGGDSGDGEAADAGGNPLAGFNADVNLTFGALGVGGNEYSPVTAVASVRDGALAIEQLSGIGPGGTAFAVSGSVTDPAAPAFSLSFDVSHPNLQRLLATFGMDGGGAPAVSVDAAGTAESDGTQLTVSGLQVALGDSDISGTITAALGDPVQASADLASNVLNLDALLPGGGGGGGGGGERWSREPLDLAALRGINADISWSIGRLVMAPTGMDNAQLTATLADGVLSVNKLTGSIGGGAVDASAVVDANGPSLSLTMTGAGVTFEPGVLAIGDVSLDGARVDLSLDVTGAGASMADIVGALNGSASLSVGGGVINGLNLGAWRDTLDGLAGNLSSLTGVLGTLGGGFEQGVLGGQTPIGALTGTFQIRNGEVYSDDLALTTDVASVDLDGAVSLPAWNLSALGNALIRQTILDNVPAIPFGLGGPLDSPTFQPDFTALQLFLGTDVMGLSLDQLPTDVLAGLGIQGLSPDMLRGIDPQQLIQGLVAGQGSVGPEAFQQLLQGGAEGESMVPQPDALLQQFLGGGEPAGEGAPAADPAAALQQLLGEEAAAPETPATPELPLDMPEPIEDVIDGVPGLDLPGIGEEPAVAPEEPATEQPAEASEPEAAEPEQADEPQPEEVAPAEAPAPDAAEPAPAEAATPPVATEPAPELEAVEPAPEPEAADPATEPEAVEPATAPQAVEPATEDQAPVEEAAPPVEETAPPAEEPAPPVEEATPPAEEAPPVEEAAPPAEEAAPPAEEAVPPAEDCDPATDEGCPEPEDSSLLDDAGAAVGAAEQAAGEVVKEVDNAVDQAGQALESLF